MGNSTSVNIGDILNTGEFELAEHNHDFFGEVSKTAHCQLRWETYKTNK